MVFIHNFLKARCTPLEKPGNTGFSLTAFARVASQVRVVNKLHVLQRFASNRHSVDSPSFIFCLPISKINKLCIEHRYAQYVHIHSADIGRQHLLKGIRNWLFCHLEALAVTQPHAIKIKANLD